MPNDKELIKVLSIDGGGIRGIIPAMVLAEIERKTGNKIAEMFDLMAGTSAGGILTLGMNVKDQSGKPKFSAEQISEIFTVDGPKIFKKSLWRRVSSIGGIIDERYDHRPLVRILKKYMDEKILKNSFTKTLISSYDILNRTPQFFKSWRDEYNKYKMWELARATSAAPTYFTPKKLTIKRKDAVLIDGGVFINNPAVSAHAEALRLRREKKLPNKPIMLISLGTGELTREITYEEAKDWGMIEWVSPILDVVFDGVSDAVNYQLGLILDEDRYFRLQIELDQAMDDFDDASHVNIIALKATAEKLIKNNEKEIDKICSIIG